AVALLNDGDLLLVSPDYAELVKEIDYSARLAPEFMESVSFRHFFLARKLDSVDTVQALTEYINAVNACPDIAFMQNNLGDCYRKLQKLDEAENCYQAAMAIDPQCVIAYSNLCQLMFQTKQYARGVE